MSLRNCSPKCLNCKDVLNTVDTKNGRDRQFCRYSGRPQCGNCLGFFTRGTKTCDNCRIELLVKRKCEKCNKLAKDDSNNCEKCKKEIIITKKCPTCNEKYDNELIECVTCRLKLREPSCVKEYSMYVTALNRIRNEIMANPHDRVNLNIIHEIFANTLTMEKDQKILVNP